jgi:hypothetical protein
MNITKIYLVTNCYNNPNWVYIGKTKTSREKPHKNRFGNQIEYTYIDEINSLEHKDWEPLETYWIEQFNAWGFEVMNKRKKGGSGPITHSEETKLKLSLANSKPKPEGFGEKITQRLLNKNQSPETINKRIEKNKGKKRTLEQKETLSKVFKGRIYSEERNKKIGDAQRGIPQPKSPETIEKLKKPILQLDLKGNLIKEWKGIIDASIALKISEGAIFYSLKNKNKRGGKYIWVYKEEWEKNKEKVNYKFILQFTLDNIFVNEFYTIKEAASQFDGEVNKISSNIGSCLRNKQKSSYGFIWKYKKD